MLLPFYFYFYITTISSHHVDRSLIFCDIVRFQRREFLPIGFFHTTKTTCWRTRALSILNQHMFSDHLLFLKAMLSNTKNLLWRWIRKERKHSCMWWFPKVKIPSFPLSKITKLALADRSDYNDPACYYRFISCLVYLTITCLKPSCHSCGLPCKKSLFIKNTV